MNSLALVHAVGSTGPFATRAFLPAFVVAALLRYGPGIPFVRDRGLLAGIDDAPAWLTSDLALWILGVLALLELVGDKIPELREALRSLDGPVKSGASLAVTLGLLEASDRTFLEGIVRAGLLDVVVLGPIVALVYFGAAARRVVLDFLSEADPEDDLKVQRLISWGEDLFAGFGMLLVLLYPFFMAGLVGLGLLALFAAARVARAREARLRVPCAGCGHAILPCARACPRCGTEVVAPCAVGFFGGPAPARPADPAALPFELASRRRCPRCAEHPGRRRDPLAPCPACGTVAFADPAFVDGFLRHVGGRVPATLVATLLLGAIPILGFVPGVIGGRVQLVAPFAGYLPAGRRFFLRWGMRGLLVAIAAIQVVPGVGAPAVPIHAWLAHRGYRSAFLEELARARRRR